MRNEIKPKTEGQSIFAFSLLAILLSAASHTSASQAARTVGGIHDVGNSDFLNSEEVPLSSVDKRDLDDIKNQLQYAPATIPKEYIVAPQTRITQQDLKQFAIKPTTPLKTSTQIEMVTSSGNLTTTKKISSNHAPVAQPQPVSPQPVIAQAINQNNQVAQSSSNEHLPREAVSQLGSNQIKTPQYANATANYRLNKKPYFYQCFHNSAIKYNVPVDLLIAIAQTESSMRTNAINDNGSTQDLGVMQINTSWIPKLSREFGLKKHHLYEPCTNIDIGAWVLAHNFVQFGYTWNAVGAYNAKTPSKRVVYVRKVANNLEKLRRGEL